MPKILRVHDESMENLRRQNASELLLIATDWHTHDERIESNFVIFLHMLAMNFNVRIWRNSSQRKFNSLWSSMSMGERRLWRKRHWFLPNFTRTSILETFANFAFSKIFLSHLVFHFNVQLSESSNPNPLYPSTPPPPTSISDITRNKLKSFEIIFCAVFHLVARLCILGASRSISDFLWKNLLLNTKQKLIK